MKVLLVNPPLLLYPREILPVVIPLGIAYVASFLEKKGHDVKMIDCVAESWRRPKKIRVGRQTLFRYDPGLDSWQELLGTYRPEIVGLSSLTTASEKEVLRVARLVKRILPQAKVVVGGANASARYQVLIKEKNVDFVVIGEGEETMAELVEKLFKKEKWSSILGLVFKNSREKVMVNPLRPLIKDLDSLPFPAWHLLPMAEYFHGRPAGTFCRYPRIASVTFSRGCPNGCSFCTNERIWGRRWRVRSVKNMLAEIKLLKKRYQIQEIQFLDNNIAVDKKRLAQLCRGLKKEKLSWIPAGGVAVLTLNLELIRLMAESGCYALQFGIEHGDLEMQRRIGKIVPLMATQKLVAECKKVGIWTHGNFIVGLPGETRQTAGRSLDYAMKADFDSVSFFTALPLPGSRIYEQLFGQKDFSVSSLRFYLTASRCSSLSPKEIQQIIRTSFQKFLFFRLKRELIPSQMFIRIKSLRRWGNWHFYYRICRRFLQLKRI